MKRSFLSHHDSSPGHRIVVRPDTYVEANLLPVHRGAPVAYNEIVGDFDSRLAALLSSTPRAHLADPLKIKRHIQTIPV